ncbi:ClpX C4-type zinc finger protein [Clostridium rectalis]|uniref:ClpX C4-type zinc finger protein n=1 Tax=Clostridium rectalis TaxID=2040295 RepID=UPI000F62EEEE|nr:ClpX C4-type zinc finger protein [Clostridium rectalis]
MMVCDFCGKNENEVYRLVANKNNAICNKCIMLCSEILLSELGEFKKLNINDYNEE